MIVFPGIYPKGLFPETDFSSRPSLLILKLEPVMALPRLIAKPGFIAVNSLKQAGYRSQSSAISKQGHTIF